MAIFTREMSRVFTRRIDGGFQGKIFLYGDDEVVMLPLEHPMCHKHELFLKDRGVYILLEVKGSSAIGSLTTYADALYKKVNMEIEKVKENIDENKTKIYRVPVIFEAWGLVDVEAKDEKDLIRKLKNKDFVDEMEIPSNWDYVEDSYKIEFEGIWVHN